MDYIKIKRVIDEQHMCRSSRGIIPIYNMFLYIINGEDGVAKTSSMYKTCGYL